MNNYELEQLVCSLKSDPRFKILKDRNAERFSDGESWELTELESKNLKVIHAKNFFVYSSTEDYITITDKNKNIHVYSNSYYACDTPIIHKKFTIDELKKYIDENV